MPETYKAEQLPNMDPELAKIVHELGRTGAPGAINRLFYEAIIHLGAKQAQLEEEVKLLRRQQANNQTGG